jgi:hypothetical protein
MKKYLLYLVLFVLCSINTLRAQSIKFGDLIYFTSLSNGEVYDYLTQGVTFRQLYTIEVNSQKLQYFKNIIGKPNTEQVVTGAYTKLYNGTYLRTVTYTAQNGQSIINMIAQAQNYGLTLKFRGADYSNNIYLLDDNYYTVSIYLRRDLSSGLVEIKQKEFYGVD